MKPALHITFHGAERSEALETRIREKVEQLLSGRHDITSCRVSVEGPPRHRAHGGTWAIHIELHRPGQPLIVSREPGHDPAHEDPFVAVRDAFETARRRLVDEAKGRRGGTLA